MSDLTNKYKVYAMIVLKISLVLYASQYAPKLPKWMDVMFENTIFKITAITLLAILAEVEFTTALIIACVYVAILSGIKEMEVVEKFEQTNGPFYSDQTKYENLLQQPATISNATLLDSLSDVYSKCQSVKMEDLLMAFDDDKVKLQDTVLFSYKQLLEQMPKDSEDEIKLKAIAKACGIPYNVQFNDTNAPYIATLLINYGFKITPTCRPPYGNDMINE